MRKARIWRAFLIRKRKFYENRNAWLGREDSNLRMVESKSTALPLGDAPIPCGKRPALSSRGFPLATTVYRGSWAISTAWSPNSARTIPPCHPPENELVFSLRIGRPFAGNSPAALPPAGQNSIDRRVERNRVSWDDGAPLPLLL